MSLLPILSQSALQNLLIFLVIFGAITSQSSRVSCARSSSSNAASSSVSAESTGGTGASSSGGGSSTRDRELISAQFRAVQDARDLDTSETGGVGGIDTLSAAAAAAAAAAGMTDEEALMSKYMAASASGYSPSKLRLNRYSQTGFYDPYPAYSSAFANVVPSSYYPYNAYTAYKENPLLDTYPYYERDRLREIQTRALQSLSPSSSYSGGGGGGSSSSSNRDGFGGNFFNGGGGGGYKEGFRSSDQDSTAMSSGHGHDDHGHGHGHGHGHYTSKVNTNAIGLLGLLGLLSLLSNVLFLFTTTTTTTTAAAGRKKRSPQSTYTDPDEDLGETHEQKRERIFMEILPHLTPVAHARDGVLPVECTFHGVCMTNKVLVNEFGLLGRSAGVSISTAIVKLFDKVIPGEGRSTKSKKKFDLKSKLESAALHGRNKKDCEKSYPVCSALKKHSAPTLPFVITMRELPQLISKLTKLTQGVPMS